MPIRFTLPLFAAAAIALGAAFCPVVAGAQPRFVVEVHDSSAVLREGQVIDLKATIRNTDITTINVRAIRIENQLPPGGWYTAMCFGEQCYPPDMDIAPDARIEAGASVEFKLSVGTELTEYGQGVVRAKIQFDTGMLTDAVEQEFVVVFDGTAAAPGESDDVVRTAWPNPARTSAFIPLEPSDRASAGLRLQLVDALGRTVIDQREILPVGDGVRVDVGGIADGAYFYRLDVDGATRTGRIVVAH